MLVACATAPAAVRVIALCIDHHLWPACLRYYPPPPKQTAPYITIGIDARALMSHRLCTAIQATPDTTVIYQCPNR
jgi:hypothetical protein